jgi:hypothetical protein
MSKGHTEKALKALGKIAKKNGKSKDYYKYLVSESNTMNEDSQSICHNQENINGMYASKDNSNKSEVYLNLDKTTAHDKTSQNINNVTSNNYHSTLISNTTMADSPILSQKKIENIVSGLEDSDEAISQLSGGNSGRNANNEPLISNSESESNNNVKEAPFSALIKYKSLRSNFLICNFLWFAMAFTYYGISMGLKKSKDDIFIDGYVVYGAEGISYMVVGIILSIPFFGRVRTLYIMLLLTSVSTCSYFFMRKFELIPYDKILLFFARFSITSIFSIMYTYSTEVYPTTIRAKGLGINCLFARFASILVPVIVEFVDPFLIYATVCFIGFFFALMLPETLGKELEDEIHEEKALKKVYVDN